MQILPDGTVALYLPDQAARALAVMMHVYDDDKNHVLAPVLRPYLRVLDRKLVRPPGRR